MNGSRKLLLSLCCLFVLLLLFLNVSGPVSQNEQAPLPPPEPTEAVSELPAPQSPPPPAPSPEPTEPPGPCSHPRHDPDMLLCCDCGEPVTHRYVNGSCSGCGKALDLYEMLLPESFYLPVPEEQRGTVETCFFPCLGYSMRALVYLPCHYGEDETQRYNVFILLPTLNGTSETCMTAPFYVPGRTCSMQTVYDNLFLSGECRPCIIVSLGFVDAFEPVEELLREEVLPYLSENYLTYAEDSSPEALRAARNHLAIGGVSNGALQTCYSGLERMVDVCANFALLSGSFRQTQILEALNGSFAGEEIDMLFISCGENDSWAMKSSVPLYESLSEQVEGLAAGENLVLHTIPGLEHAWTAFHLEIFDALRICFPNT